MHAIPVKGYVPLSIWQDIETGLGWMIFDYGDTNPLGWDIILTLIG